MKPWGQQGKRIIWNSKNQTRTNTQIIRRLSQAKNHSSSGTLTCSVLVSVLFSLQQNQNLRVHTHRLSVQQTWEGFIAGWQQTLHPMFTVRAKKKSKSIQFQESSMLLFLETILLVPNLYHRVGLAVPKSCWCQQGIKFTPSTSCLQSLQQLPLQLLALALDFKTSGTQRSY